MSLTQTEEHLAYRYFLALLEAATPLQEGPDQEITLQALIRAAQMLQERLERELDELRQESD